MKEIKISSKDKTTLLHLKQYMVDYKRNYNMVIEYLNAIGKFTNPLLLNYYDSINDEEQDKYYAYFGDKDENVYIMCLRSNDRKDIDIIERQTNNGDEFYDLSLSKKFIIKEDNVRLLRTKNTYGFRHGRVITDGKSFYSIFLGDNIAYQLNIETANSKININELIERLNKLDEKPDFATVTSIFHSVIVDNGIEFKKMDLSFYKDLKICDSFFVEDNPSDSNKKVPKKVLKDEQSKN